jgi:diketogulonate reductase-like aldo/keto reductase
VLGAVGVTNFDVPRLEAMMNKGAQIVSNQVGWASYHLFSQDLTLFCY